MSVNYLLGIYSADKEYLDSINKNRSIIHGKTYSFIYENKKDKSFATNFYDLLNEALEFTLSNIYIHYPIFSAFLTINPRFVENKAIIFLNKGETVKIEIEFEDSKTIITNFISDIPPHATPVNLLRESQTALESLFRNKDQIKIKTTILLPSPLEELSNFDINENAVHYILKKISKTLDKNNQFMINLLLKKLKGKDLDLFSQFISSKNVSFLQKILQNQEKNDNPID